MWDILAGRRASNDEWASRTLDPKQTAWSMQSIKKHTADQELALNFDCEMLLIEVKPLI